MNLEGWLSENLETKVFRDKLDFRSLVRMEKSVRDVLRKCSSRSVLTEMPIGEL